MKLIFLICFGYFCFNQVILTSTAKIENGNIPEEIFKSIEFPLCRHTEHKTQLMDLNDDCLFLVLNHLNLNSLFAVAEAHIGLNSMILEIVKKIFRKKEFHAVMEPFDDSNRVRIGHDYIRMTSVSAAERLFKNFGYLIENLKIYRFNQEMDNATRSIYKLVNLHCSKTLNEIRLDNSVNNFLDEFTNQFENVQNVYIRNSLETDRRLNEIFPSVRRLDFLTIKISNANSINVKYENLEHLKLSFNTIPGSLIENLAAELIRKNSHIRSLEFRLASPQLIKIAADSLPQLERLKLDYIQCKNFNQSISLPNLKIFETSKSYLDYLLPNLKFGNVEELYIDGLVESMFEQTGFFATNKNLKKLQLVSPHMYLTTIIFEKFAQANSTLQEIYIDGAYGFDATSILQLIENSKQLKRLQIVFCSHETRKSISKDLRGRISDIWSMEELNLYTIILKKEK